jgi:hypothetical protein
MSEDTPTALSTLIGHLNAALSRAAHFEAKNLAGSEHCSQLMRQCREQENQIQYLQAKLMHQGKEQEQQIQYLQAKLDALMLPQYIKGEEKKP